MTSNPASAMPNPGPRPDAGRPAHRDWIPAIPRPLQRLFDSVPLVTYPPNELPHRSPAPSDLPTLHVFTTPEGAARGLPSYNPSCLKWQTFLRIAGIPHNLAASTNHASPSGALPFLQPALATADRLDARALLPIPSSRLDTYAYRFGTLPPRPEINTHTTTTTTPDQRHHRQQAYEALLAAPIRNAWLFALYLSPPNEPLLRALYLVPASRAGPVQSALLRQLRAAARAEIAKAPEAATASGDSWALGGNVGDLLAWALGGRRAVLDPEAVYEQARRAFEALETLLSEAEGEGAWFFGAERPGLFDAHVFSYTHLILSDGCYGPSIAWPRRGGGGERLGWKDETLRGIVRDGCPALVAHAERMLGTYWPADGEKEP